MKRWKKVLLGIGGFFLALIAFLGIGGYAIDPKIELGIEKKLAAAPRSVSPLLQSASGLDEWWTVAQEGSPAKMLVKKESGPDEGAGLVVTFVADEHVMETWTVREAEPSRVVYVVDFAGMMTVERTLTLSSDGTGTLVSWSETGELKNPFLRWMKVLMPADSIEKNFDMALTALDKAAATP